MWCVARVTCLLIINNLNINMRTTNYRESNIVSENWIQRREHDGSVMRYYIGCNNNRGNPITTEAIRLRTGAVGYARFNIFR